MSKRKLPAWLKRIPIADRREHARLKAEAFRAMNENARMVNAYLDAPPGPARDAINARITSETHPAWRAAEMAFLKFDSALSVRASNG
jgi:hypothetical protein